MSISITSTAEWFRCISPAATREERHTALAKLVRMLVGDSARPRPPISLAGQLVIPTAPLPTAVTPEAPTVRYLRRALPTGKAVNAPSRDGDAREPYSRRRLQRMNRSFVKRLERAIAHGQERPHA
jgi:hypothetical protein